MRRHVESVHRGVVYPCEECGKVFRTESGLKRHERSHKVETELTCEHCGKTFNRKENLVCGEPLGSTTDQIIEGMHSYVDKIMKKSGHWIDDSSTILCGLKQHEGVLKINAFSMNLK